MPVGLAKDLVSSSTGSGSGGLGALVGTGGINANSGSLGTAGSGGPIQLPTGTYGTTQLDMSLNNLFDSLKMKNGPLVHQNNFDLTQKLNEEIFLRSILGGANSSGEHPIGVH